jgi:hypothetical protein
MRETPKMMKCGCAANCQMARDGKNYKPGCGIHQCDEPADNPPNLEGRTAVCQYGLHHPVPSSLDLAFFVYRPNEKNDRYYCGCHGWD